MLLVPKAEFERHNVPQIVDLSVRENFSEPPTLYFYLKARDRGLSLEDTEIVTPECD